MKNARYYSYETNVITRRDAMRYYLKTNKIVYELSGCIEDKALVVLILVSGKALCYSSESFAQIHQRKIIRQILADYLLEQTGCKSIRIGGSVYITHADGDAYQDL